MGVQEAETDVLELKEKGKEIVEEYQKNLLALWNKKFFEIILK